MLKCSYNWRFTFIRLLSEDRSVSGSSTSYEMLLLVKNQYNEGYLTQKLKPMDFNEAHFTLGGFLNKLLSLRRKMNPQIISQFIAPKKLYSLVLCIDSWNYWKTFLHRLKCYCKI